MATIRLHAPALLLALLACAPERGALTTASSTSSTSAGTLTTGTTGTPDATSTSSTGTPMTSSASSSSTGFDPCACSFLECDPPPCWTTGPSGIECDVWTQDCPDGQKCMPWANDGTDVWNATKCTDVMPNPGKPGEACTVEGNNVSGIDSCDKAAMCWDLDPNTGMGTCVAFCDGSQEAPKCAAGTTCAMANGGVLILCLPTCNPLLQDCPAGDTCFPQPMGDGFVCLYDTSGDAGQQNDPCGHNACVPNLPCEGEILANGCDAGLLCVNPVLATECDPMAAGCCLPFCDLSSPQCTNQGATCLPWYDMGMAPPGYENLGVCGLPQ